VVYGRRKKGRQGKKRWRSKGERKSMKTKGGQSGNVEKRITEKEHKVGEIARKGPENLRGGEVMRRGEEKGGGTVKKRPSGKNKKKGEAGNIGRKRAGTGPVGGVWEKPAFGAPFKWGLREESPTAKKVGENLQGEGNFWGFVGCFGGGLPDRKSLKGRGKNWGGKTPVVSAWREVWNGNTKGKLREGNKGLTATEEGG